MKQLQNDFTTPEQSKKLLELGVPVLTANIVYYNTPDSMYDPYLITEEKQKRDVICGRGMPCWSVGRLIEILSICAGEERVDFETLAWAEGTWLEKLVMLLEDLEKHDELDFSNLEE